MNKQNDLYIEYARVIEMCKCTALENTPWLGVKCEGVVQECHPMFRAPPDSYEFAIAILEDRPVFNGDKLYWKTTGSEYTVNSYNQCASAPLGAMTWQPPKPKRRIVLEETNYEYDCEINGAFWRIVEDTWNKP